MSTFVIPQGFAYVGASLLSTALLLLGQSVVVGRYRRIAGIKYPQLYAEKAEVEASEAALKFNCAQRAHHNTLENWPAILTMTLIFGIKYPIYAASACALWTLTRISYTRGYITGDPKKRLTMGARGGYPALIALTLGSAWTVWQLIVAGN